MSVKTFVLCCHSNGCVVRYTWKGFKRRRFTYVIFVPSFRWNSMFKLHIIIKIFNSASIRLVFSIFWIISHITSYRRHKMYHMKMTIMSKRLLIFWRLKWSTDCNIIIYYVIIKLYRHDNNHYINSKRYLSSKLYWRLNYLIEMVSRRKMKIILRKKGLN